MAVQKALVDRVVDHLDALVRNGQQLFDFVLGELRHRDHARRLAQHAPRQIKVQAAPQTGSVARSVHVLQQIVHGQNIRTTEPARNPVQVWNVNHVALQPPHNRPEIETPFQRVIAVRPAARRGSSAAALHIPPFVRRSDEEILAVAVQAAPACGPRSGCTCQPRIPSCDGCRWRLSRLEFKHRGTEDTGNSLSTIRLCHPERSKGSAVCRKKQVLRFAQDDKT
jgi:hypothetical protein